MSSIFGNNIKISIFGQSHSAAIGVTIDGLPAGYRIDTDRLQAFMDRRAPGRSVFSTSRRESDVPEIICGTKDGITCGAPLTCIIRNEDVRSSDYDNIKDMPRPGHADYTAHIKYDGYEDHRGGGHLSGRLTAPLCVAGGIAMQILAEYGIQISSEIAEIGGKKDDFESTVIEAKNAGDSVGGIIRCTITGVPAGTGAPIFDGVENRIAQAVFAVPAVKGIEFGAGFDAARKRGSENNDPFAYDEDGNIRTSKNDCGGILGGIADGEEIVFSAAIKPTPSIGLEQKTVSYGSGKNADISVSGRHDPCIVMRAGACIEAAAAIAVIDMISL